MGEKQGKIINPLFDYVQRIAARYNLQDLSVEVDKEESVSIWTESNSSYLTLAEDFDANNLWWNGFSDTGMILLMNEDQVSDPD